ncbi:formate dehydrogenase subunit delta [uncultured Methylobacterium sp.]|jgi:formate dehydrogenase subunit delta|uniref:formate dehydrogenase subunit delta n=1 Tax=uncultured Methylobacterium sp. TaxID=157278 RepID=UPI00262F6B39|nr:formate dehydrogenase subunit delta [uncultured Methylobacterium sp.]
MTADPNQKLVRMANQIATFFRSYPEEEAVAGIHKHIVAFWTPKMRDQLIAHCTAEDHGLDPLALTALTITPKAKSPIREATTDPHEIGMGASDAG